MIFLYCTYNGMIISNYLYTWFILDYKNIDEQIFDDTYEEKPSKTAWKGCTNCF